MSNRTKKGLLPFLILTAAVLLAWLLVNSREDLPRRERAAIVPLVEVVVAEPVSVPVAITSRGTVTPQHNIELVSEVSGRVVWVSPAFEEGVQIKAGEALLRIDPIDYEVALSEARAAVASAELSLAEVRVLEKRAAVEDAKASVAAAKDRLRQAEVNLEYTQVAAPFDAIVDAKRADIGQYVQSGTALVKLLSTEKALVRLPLLSSDLPFVDDPKADSQMIRRATLIATMGAQRFTWEAPIVRIEKRVDAQTRIFYAVAEVERPYDNTLHPRALALGQFVEAVIEGAPVPAAVVLPRSALHDGDNVYLVEGGTLSRRAVTVARREGSSVIVSGGLSSGDRVVVSKLDLMIDGMSVAVKSL